MGESSKDWETYQKFDAFVKATELEGPEEEAPSQLDNIDMSKVPKGMFVSGWDDEDDMIETESDPHETPEKEFLWAATEDMPELVAELLKKHPDLINIKDRDGYTALHKAAYNNNYDLALKLISHGADVDARTELQWTPLHTACKWNHPKIVALLLQFGADINARSEGDQTPLHIACTVSNCRDTLVTLFMDDNLKPHLLNNSGETAEQIARRTGLCSGFFRMVDSPLQVHMGLLE